MTQNKTFIRITNQMIYDRIVSIDSKIGKVSGTVKWHTWAIGTLIVLVTAIISRLI